MFVIERGKSGPEVRGYRAQLQHVHQLTSDSFANKIGTKTQSPKDHHKKIKKKKKLDLTKRI